MAVQKYPMPCLWVEILLGLVLGFILVELYKNVSCKILPPLNVTVKSEIGISGVYDNCCIPKLHRQSAVFELVKHDKSVRYC